MKHLVPLTLAFMIILCAACGNNDAPASSAIIKTGDSADIEQQAVQETRTGHEVTAPSSGDSLVNAGGDFTPPEANDTVKLCYITKLYSKAGSEYIDADYIQLFTGEKAVAEARKRNKAIMDVNNGDTTWSLPDDLFFLNENTKIRTLRLRADASFMQLVFEPVLAYKRIARDTFKKTQNKENIYILTVLGDSVVTAIRPQYLP